MNPLLREAELPRFDQIDASHVVPAISAILEENQAEIDRHKMASTPEQAYRAFHEFESLEARLAEAWSPVSHLNAVVNNDELRAAYNACLPLISAYETAQGQDPALKSLFEVLKQNAGSLVPSAPGTSPAHTKTPQVLTNEQLRRLHAPQ